MQCPSGQQPTRPSLLKRKRKNTDDENSENNPPPNHQAQQCILHKADSTNHCSGDLHNMAEHLTEPSSEEETEYISPPSWDQHNPLSAMLTPISERFTPLPTLPWAKSEFVWDLMCQKDEISLCERDEDMFERHPYLQARMRSILLDWLIEVCEVYKLHRETYHLTMDFIDRYLSKMRNVPKQHLQLIGITCLFIAAKVEEIYPPKLAEFAYVTDGACTEAEIMDMEIIILKSLNWKLASITANGWLSTFMQLLYANQLKMRQHQSNKPDNFFLLPQFSGMAFIQTARLVDLCMLDIGCLRFSYSVIATSALYHTLNRKMTLSVSGMQWSDIEACVNWMSAFVSTLRETESSLESQALPEHTSDIVRAMPHIIMDESHKIQTHSIDLNMLETAQQRLSSQSCIDVSPLKEVPSSPTVLTPPSSRKKRPQQVVVAESLV
uniref:Cyclin E n=1 Tax=Timema genevievae TaxID=629358 RepID=A0A7R9K0L5_TIMGE|nr:unnamed protein product [Timema genevievae]